MIRWGAGRIAATAMAACVVGLMSGCALLAPPAHSKQLPAPKTPEALTIDQQLPNLLVAGQTIATGQLRLVDHEPIAAPAAQHPVTGAVQIVVGADRGIDVHIRPDDPAAADLTGLNLMMTGKRYDGLPVNIQDESYYGLDARPTGAAAGELVLRMPLDSPSAGDPSFLHSIEEFPAGDGRVIAAAALTWTLPSAYPGLKPVDSGVVTNAHGRVVMDHDVLAYYIPNPYDTIYMVSRRFGLTEAQLVWLNPELLIDAPDAQLKSGIGVNLDPARR